MLDVLIRNGWVADGTGSPPFLGDVAIEGGEIVEVGRLGAAATATRVVDASGKVVCPGFVDPHSHSDFSLLANPTAESTIRQGVTTEVVGNCGWSYAPVSDHSREYMSGRLHTLPAHAASLPPLCLARVPVGASHIDRSATEKAPRDRRRHGRRSRAR